MPNKFVETLQQALKLHHPYPELEGISQAKLAGAPASVLMLFTEVSPHSLLMTQRTQTVETHKGQMAFPGGVHEEGESDEQAALRETHEEVGISPESIHVLGKLPKLWTVSRFWVTPIVGVIAENDFELKWNESEIETAFWIPFSTLSRPSIYSTEQREFQGRYYATHIYQVDEYRIWGATGAMIKNLLDRMKQVG